MSSRSKSLFDLGLPLSAAELRPLAQQLQVELKLQHEPEVFVRGELPARPGIAVVGTRHPTKDALQFTSELARELGQLGYSVWSGGALGIDRAAHLGALDAKLPTVLVAPTGLDHPYPKSHRGLYDRIIEQGGALVSLWPDATVSGPHRFFPRNRALAGLTVATVVVQASPRSGARNAAKAARRLGRPVCAVPQAPWCRRGSGCVEELRCGARLVRNARDVAQAVSRSRHLLTLGLGPATPDDRTERSPGSASRAGAAQSMPQPRPGARKSSFKIEDLSDDEAAVLAVLAEQPRHLDELCTATGRPPAGLARALLTLTLRAVVVEGPAGHYRRHAVDVGLRHPTRRPAPRTPGGERGQGE